MKALQYISRLYQRLIKIGVTQDQLFAEKLRTELCNQLIVIAFPVTILHLIYNMLGPNILHEYFLVLLWILILGTTLVLNHYKKYFIARIYTILIPLIMVSIIVVLFGLKTRIDFIYILYILISCYILKWKHALGMIALILTTYASIVVYLSYVPPPFERYILTSGAYAYFTFATIITIVQTTKVLREYRKHSHTQIQQNQKLARQKKELERFTYIASHDLKSPLNNIIGFAELMKEDLQATQRTNLLSYLSYIQTSAQQMHGLIEDILQLAKIRDEKHREKAWIDLNSLFQEMENKLKSEIQMGEISIHCQDLPIYYGNKTEFRLLFHNLLQNGLKFNESSQPEIEISTTQTKESLYLYFKDNGIGIPQNHQSEIFQYFKRLHTQDEYKGTGIGLALCKKIIQNHNGKISVQSLPQKGSTFIIELPLII